MLLETCLLLKLQTDSLPAGGALRAAELAVSKYLDFFASSDSKF